MGFIAAITQPDLIVPVTMAKAAIQSATQSFNTTMAAATAPTPVPTPSQWELIVLSLLLGVVGLGRDRGHLNLSDPRYRR